MSLARAGLFIVAAICVLPVPNGAGHGAPDPPEWMTRLLADYNDDFGGPDGHSAVRDGHDLIALDVQEAYNATLRKDTLVFRFALNYGWDSDTTRPELRNVLTFKAKGQSVSKEIRTDNNQAFSGTFDAVSGPTPVRKSDGTSDGTRFYVSATLRYETLGLKVGDKLTEFFVQGHAGSQMADHMVGGYTVGNQRIDQEPPSEQSDPQAYRRSEYALRGPVMYAQSQVDKTKVDLRPGENVTLTWRITNSVGRAQTISLTHAPPAGVKVGMHSGAYSESRLVLSLQPGVTATVHAYFTHTPTARPGTAVLDLETSLGGHQQVPIEVTVSGAPGSPSPGPEGSPPAADSNGPGILLLVTAIMGASLLRRRGR